MKAILFDLDGTLLSLDQEKFIEGYMRVLVGGMVAHGCPAEGALAGALAGIGAMMKNDGRMTNEMAFATTCQAATGFDILPHRKALETEIYGDSFLELLRGCCAARPGVRPMLDELHARGVRIALATTPLFPRVATLARMRVAGLTADEFALVSTYEDYSYVKPTAGYYRTVLARLGARPEECMMVGNDVHDDMPAADLGMEVFLLTDELLNPDGADISHYPHGDLAAMREAVLAFAARP